MLELARLRSISCNILNLRNLQIDITSAGKYTGRGGGIGRRAGLKIQ